MELARALVGADAMLQPGVGGDGLHDPIWHHGLMFSPALTIGGGTWAVQRNIIGERVLGLPADPA